MASSPPPRTAATPAAVLAWLLAALALAAGIGLREPWPPDEPRFVLAARHMAESGDWLIPRRGDEIYAHKPPPFMWLLALAHRLTGEWRIAFLLPSWLAALGTLALAADLARRLWGRRAAAWAAGALFASLQFGLQAKRAQIDMVLVFLTTLGLWALARALLRAEGRRLALLGGMASGLGTVTKGVGFLPLLAFLPARLARHRPPLAPLLAAAFAGLLLGASVWLAPLALRALLDPGPEIAAYLEEILLRQTAERYFDPWHHHQPAWYFLQVIATLWLPGALLLPWLLPAWWRRLRRREPRTLLLVGWAGLVLLFFSLSPGKREVYILPALPALCVAAAPMLPVLLRRSWPRRLLLGYLLLLPLGMLAVASALGSEGKLSARLLAERGLAPGELEALARGLLLSALALAASLGALARGLPAAVFIATVTLWSAYGLLLVPPLDRSSSARGLMAETAARLGPGRELGLVGWREQHLLQLPVPATTFGFERPLGEQLADAEAWLRAAPARRALFALEALLPDCARLAATPLGRANRRAYRLLPGEALAADCRLVIPGDLAAPE
ncbi:MAG: glycosyltransferase family 39 protein [Xanthomonadales bacterium]|nr:glycosyltransferase family 39 protein [Xanthomonadales bacterium]